MEPNSRAELSSLVEAGLGYRVDEKLLDALETTRRRLQEEQEELALLLKDEKISKKEYLEQLESYLKVAEKDGEKILGEKRFHQIFGELSVNDLVDRATFLEPF